MKHFLSLILQGPATIQKTRGPETRLGLYRPAVLVYNVNIRGTGTAWHIP
jgi:hypothetical protein